jgi:hypothetical protein
MLQRWGNQDSQAKRPDAADRPAPIVAEPGYRGWQDGQRWPPESLSAFGLHD